MQLCGTIIDLVDWHALYKGKGLLLLLLAHLLYSFCSSLPWLRFAVFVKDIPTCVLFLIGTVC